MKRITVLKKRMKKKLTVRTLSFIMAAGLLLIVVPFVAIASGSEKPEPGKRGDFRLLKEFYAVTQVTLEEDMASNPKVSAECSSAESYQWQAYSRGQERYADLPNYVGSDLSISVSFARQYNYGNGESYFRCLATDSDGNLLISDVLTVVLPKPQVKETEETQTEETGATISTIELLEPTQPGETEPTETVESTTAPTEETTAPTEETTAPTEETTAPAEETTAPTTAPTQPTEEDSDPPKGSLVIPDTEEDEDVPLRGMLLVPLRAVETTYTVNYYIQKPEYTGMDDNAADYVLYKTESVTANVGDAVDLTRNKPGTSFDAYLTQHATLGKATGTVAADGASVFNVYFIRKTYTFIFNNTSGSTVGIKDKYNKTHRIGINASYEFKAKYGENLIGLWPTNDMFTTLPYAFVGDYYYESATEDMQYGYNTYYNPPQKLDSEFLSASHKQTYDMNFKYYILPTPCSLSFYFQNEDGTYNNSPDFVKRGNNTIYNDNNLPSYSGFSSGTPTPNSGNTRSVRYYRNQYTLTYNANGDTPPPDSKLVYFDKVLTAEEYNKPMTRDGYIFQGWYYDEGFNNPVGWDVDKMPMANITVHAKWRFASVPHTITFYNTNEEQKTLTFGQSLEGQIPNSPSPDAAHATGYSFGGWYSDSGLTNSHTFPGTMPNEDIVVYAKWNKLYTLTINPNKPGSYSTSREVAEGKNLGELGITNPSWSGHDFLGWCIGSDSSSVIDLDETAMSNSNMTIVAKWKYEIKFYLTLEKAHQNADSDYVLRSTDRPLMLEKGATVSDRQTDYGSLSALDDYSFTGETKAFAGWFYDTENPSRPRSPAVEGGEQPFIIGETQVVGDMNIYAKWNPYYTVTFLSDKNDSSSDIKTETVVSGGTISVAPGSPTKDYFTFKEWKYDVEENGVTTSQTFTFGDTGTVVTGNMTVYAEWVKNQITLNIQNTNLRDNIFTVTGGEVDLQVVVPAGNTVSVVISEKQLPFGTYTVSATNWDFRSSYTLTNTPVNATAAQPGVTFDVSASGSAKANIHWLGGDFRGILNVGSAG